MDTRKKMTEKLRLFYNVEVDILSVEDFDRVVDGGIIEYKNEVVEVTPLFDEIGKVLCGKRRPKTRYSQIYVWNESFDNLFEKYNHVWDEIKKGTKEICDIKMDQGDICACNIATTAFSAFSIATKTKFKNVLIKKLDGIKEICENLLEFPDMNFIGMIKTDIDRLDEMNKNADLWIVDSESSFEMTQDFMEIKNRADGLKRLLQTKLSEYLLGNSENMLRSNYDLSRVLWLFDMYKLSIDFAAYTQIWDLFFSDIFNKEIRLTTRMSIERLKLELGDIAEKIMQSRVSLRSDDLHMLDGYVEVTEWLNGLFSSKIIIGVDEGGKVSIIRKEIKAA